MSNKKLDTIEKFHIPRWNELPNIDLYLDQVVTFINTSLSKILIDNANSGKEKNPIVTKTMINNYVKNNLIDAPVKKKYSKIQCAKIFVICILKQVYSMNEIYNLINIALEKNEIEYAYDSFCYQFEKALDCAFSKKDFLDKDSSDEEKYLLKSVLLSCSYKIYSQKIIQERDK